MLRAPRAARPASRSLAAEDSEKAAGWPRPKHRTCPDGPRNAGRTIVGKPCGGLKNDPQTRTSRSSAFAHAVESEREKAIATGCDEFDAKTIESRVWSRHSARAPRPQIDVPTSVEPQEIALNRPGESLKTSASQPARGKRTGSRSPCCRDLDRDFGDHHHGDHCDPQAAIAQGAFERGSDGLNILGPNTPPCTAKRGRIGMPIYPAAQTKN